MEKDEAVKQDQSAAAGEQEVIVDSGASAELEVEPDWKDLLRLERERADKAEGERDNYKEGLLSQKRQEKIRRQSAENDGEGEDKVAEAVKKALEPVLSTIQGSKVDQILASLVTDPSKREYVRSLYQTRIQRTGTSEDAIRTDLEAALSLADSARRAKENEELKRMHDNRTYIPPAGAGGAQDKGAAQKVHKWTPEQEASLEFRARANGITDVEKYKELAWKAANDGSAFSVKKKYL